VGEFSLPFPYFRFFRFFRAHASYAPVQYFSLLPFYPIVPSWSVLLPSVHPNRGCGCIFVLHSSSLNTTLPFRIGTTMDDVTVSVDVDAYNGSRNGLETTFVTLSLVLSFYFIFLPFPSLSSLLSSLLFLVSVFCLGLV
jgi:hypothetical protein